MKNLIVLTLALMFPVFAGTAHSADLTDAQIAHIVVTANTVDIEAGNLAKNKASHKDVQGYAHRMIEDHTDVNKQATDLATKLKVTPQDNAISKDLRADGKKNLDKLNGLMKGSEFDKAYIDGEVKLHKQLIEVVDKKLVPDAKNEDLKALLIKVRPTLVSHLEHAKQLQTSLADKR
ncbi:MAG: DUF4142 domain-containing protein [Ginsengibacter sp.]